MLEKNNNKSKDVNKCFDITDEKYLSKLTSKQLLILKGNIERTIDKKILKKKLENYEDKKYVTLKLRDYMMGYRRKEIKLLINNDNLVEGFNEDCDRLIIGKIADDNKVYLLDYNTAIPKIKCYEGKINLDSKMIIGFCSCRECLNSHVQKMDMLKKTEVVFENLQILDEKLDYKELKYNIRKLEADILERVRYTKYERKLLMEIKEM